MNEYPIIIPSSPELEYQLEIDEQEPVTDKQAQKVKAKNSLYLKKRITREVQMRKVLYDPKHPKFSNVESKNAAWNDIAESLKLDVNHCKNTWADLRFDYQRHTRKLRKWLQRAKHDKPIFRPVMLFENDMLFLWRFISRASYCTKEPIPQKPIDDDVVILDDDDDPMIVIEIEDDPLENMNSTSVADKSQSHSSKRNATGIVLNDSIKQMIELIKFYPELYDTTHMYYNDGRRKGIIWNSIANEMNDKATKCIKYWIDLQTRYEFLLSKAGKTVGIDKDSRELNQLLHFLKPHILKNPNTIYKQSYSLMSGWCEPIENFKSISNLLTCIKRFPVIATTYEASLLAAREDFKFVPTWIEIGRQQDCPPGSCEVTWLIMREFYWQLMSIRRAAYQLQDKWHFENIITELYAQSIISKEKKTSQIRNKLSHLALAKQELSQLLPAESAPAQATAPVAPIPALGLILTPEPLQASSPTPSRAPLLGPSFASISGKVQITVPAKTGSPVTTTLPKKPVRLLISRAPVPSVEIPTVPLVQIGVHDISQKAISERSVQGTVLVSASATASTPTLTSASATAPASTPATASASTPASAPASAPVLAPTSVPATASAPAQTLSPIPASTPAPSVATYDSKPNRNNDLKSDQKVYDNALEQSKSLNANEIMIKLIATSSGKQLIAYGPPLSEKYSMTMEETTRFIQEIMAVPFLHCKLGLSSNILVINTCWQHISNVIGLPSHVCKALWNFLKLNFSHFHQIAPLDVLMAPTQSKIFYWQTSTVLFHKFQKTAVRNDWVKYKEILAKIVTDICNYSFLYTLYADVKRSKKRYKSISPITNGYLFLSQKYPQIDPESMKELWFLLKSTYLSYMVDIEKGVENQWPSEWLDTLTALKFLCKVRYHNLEPYFYIVRNKIEEDIKRCRGKNNISVDNNIENSINIKCQILRQNLIDLYNDGNVLDNSASPTTLSSPLRQLSSPHARYIQLNRYSLMKQLQQHPEIFDKRSNNIEQKNSAWKKIAKELQTTVISCQSFFEQTVKSYRRYCQRDPQGKCRLNQIYFSPMMNIYSEVLPNSRTAPNRLLNIRTPSEIVRTSLAEEIQPDLWMEKDKIDLTLKNLIKAINSLPLEAQAGLPEKLSALFDTYRNAHHSRYSDSFFQYEL